jgi:hypothetical protein
MCKLAGAQQQQDLKVMSLETPNVIDAMSTDPKDGTVSLNIIDDWDWADEKRHLLALQQKLNAYFDFVQSGQVYEAYPNAIGNALRIHILTQFPIPAIGLKFLEIASKAAAQLKTTISYQQLA